MGDHGYWFVAIALGLVVAVVTVILLEVFLREVYRIEQGAASVWTAGKQVARNTSTTWLLGATSDRLTALTEEAGRHADLLGPPAPSPTRARLS